jgi:hypothetical protein
MYTNIPQDELPHIIQYALENSHTTHDTFITEVQNLIHVILEQNYFQFYNLLYKQTHGLAVGARTSALFAKIFLKYTVISRFMSLIQSLKTARKAKTRKTKINFPLLPDRNNDRFARGRSSYKRKFACKLRNRY